MLAILGLAAAGAAQAADVWPAATPAALRPPVAEVGFRLPQAPLLPADPVGPVTLPDRAPIPAPDDLSSPGPGPGYGPLGLPCDAALTAEAAAGATVALRVEAPCLAGRPVTLRHGALAASYLASSSGIVETRFPAFAPLAEFKADLADGRTLTACAAVPGAGGYERMATMWEEGHPGLAVHAFEFGAAPGSAGHVWAGAPRTPAAADSGRGGYLLALGTPGLSGGLRAEVYSFPAAGARRPGAVRLALAAADGACGGSVEAVTLQLGEDLPGAPVRVSLPLPDCGAVGRADRLLKNLARDLKIAVD